MGVKAMLVPITIRVPEEVANKIKELSQESNVTESEYLRRVIEKGLKTERQNQVLSAYEGGQIHLSEAARLLDMSIWDFLSSFPRGIYRLTSLWRII